MDEPGVTPGKSNRSAWRTTTGSPFNKEGGSNSALTILLAQVRERNNSLCHINSAAEFLFCKQGVASSNLACGFGKLDWVGNEMMA